MDAPESPSSSRFARPWVVRLVAFVVAVILVAGLWQGYGAWLLGVRDAG